MYTHFHFLILKSTQHGKRKIKNIYLHTQLCCDTPGAPTPRALLSHPLQMHPPCSRHQAQEFKLGTTLTQLCGFWSKSGSCPAKRHRGSQKAIAWTSISVARPADTSLVFSGQGFSSATAKTRRRAGAPQQPTTGSRNKGFANRSGQHCQS